ncbi:MAG: UDP-N-acetylmuramate--L-alanine ligase [Bacteroidota bacterium]
MSIGLSDIQHPFFIGVGGSGMSALAQYLQGSGKQVSGSDRLFQFPSETRDKLEASGILCYEQDGSGMLDRIDCVIVSTAVEDSVTEYQLAKQRGLPILHRSDLLALIASSRKTIAIAGTSGKSTTSAMLFSILVHAGYDPGIISGAGLTSLVKQGKIGNAAVGSGEWLIIEADESDGSIIRYHPEIGVLLNIDKDHQELDELTRLFRLFRDQSRFFSVNHSHPLTRALSVDGSFDFSSNSSDAAYHSDHFVQNGLTIYFDINGIPFQLNQVGAHNMENALAAAAVAHRIGVPLHVSADALRTYEGIYRRHQVLGNKQGIWLVDDFAHNPVKCAASIRACQPIAPKLIAWFQPHGFKPTRFLRSEYVHEFSQVVRPGDEIWMSEIFYAGGTAQRDISAGDLIDDLKQRGVNAHFVPDRNHFLEAVRPHLTNDCTLLLMGARDPSLEGYAQDIWRAL